MSRQPLSAAERGRLAAAARAATIAATRPTTRPGSEATTLAVGDAVRVTRKTGRTGTWSRYAGRTGFVAVLNLQKFPNGTPYVEIGVAWTRQADMTKASADAWFRADEVEPA
jgi:hypothetical protein